MATEHRWNSNLHAFDALLGHVPAGATRGLDVGCGEGETARRLRQRVASVVALDPHEPSIVEARSYDDDIDYRLGDLESTDLPSASFDVVSAVAMLHHLDLSEGLRRLADLVAPGGQLLIVGLARSRSLQDYGRDARDAVMIRRHTMTKHVWDTPAPKVWPPPLTYPQTERVCRTVLPDATFRRVPYFRYALTWKRASPSA